MASVARFVQRSASRLLTKVTEPAATLGSACDPETPLEVEVMPFQTHKCEAPSTKVSTTRGELLEMFEKMSRMRSVETTAKALYQTKLIRGFCHLYDGQEAVIMGISAGSDFKDSIITSYRDHALHLMRGGTVNQVIGELLGRSNGASRGLGGSMHMYNKKNNYYGGSGIVGAQVPVGAGLGLAHKLKGEASCAFALYGDGAANQGQIAEALNMAALWNVPVIFVCENNHYGMGTSARRGSKSAGFYRRGDYVPGIRVDGMDPLAVKHATVWAKQFVLENGPLVFEADTYRYQGHSPADPANYRTKDEVSSMRKARDPVERVRKLLLDQGLAEAADLKQIEKQVKAEVAQAVEESKAASQPPLDMLQANIYQDPTAAVMRGATSEQYIQATNRPYDP